MNEVQSLNDFIKKEAPAQVFSYAFCNFFRTAFFQKILLGERFEGKNSSIRIWEIRKYKTIDNTLKFDLDRGFVPRKKKLKKKATNL